MPNAILQPGETSASPLMCLTYYFLDDTRHISKSTTNNNGPAPLTVFNQGVHSSN